MKLIYNTQDRPSFGKLLVFAVQQLLAIMAATLVVPVIVGNGMDSAAALFGAGIGTLVYLLFTGFKSPVFLGSSFSFINSMAAAFAGAASVSLGYLGIIIGACLAALVYVVIAILVKVVGVDWINYLMPSVVIGPTVAIIGLSLAGNAVGDLKTANAGGAVNVAVLCGLVTLFATILCSVFGKKTVRLIPFIIGILCGYALAAVLTIIGNAAGIDAIKVTDFTPLTTLGDDGVAKALFRVPEFTFLTAFGAFGKLTPSYVGTVAVAYVPVAFVVFAEHIADHKNISSIIEKDLLKDPGLHRTLLGDGVGSFAGAFFGGCPNTTYGESIACVAISGNASVWTIFTAANLAIIISFLSPFVAFVNSIPKCVMGGVCVALYGFIAVSGLKMVQKVDLEDSKNLFVVSTILVAGIGGLSLNFGHVTVTSIATALILGIIINVLLTAVKGEKKGK